jgi:NAD(P)H-flavin reductase
MPIFSHGDVARLAVPLAAVAGILGLVCYFWPRQVKTLLDKTRKRVQVIEVVQISHDTKKIRLSTGGKNVRLGLPIGKHICLFAPNPKKCLDSGKWNGKDDPDKGEVEIKRNYTPTPRDEKGFVEIVAKVYRPGTVKMPDGRETVWEDGGKMSLHLDSLKVGDWMDLDGPIGHIQYLGKGKFKVPGQTRETKHVGMMAGGTGITPMLQVVAAALDDPSDQTRFSLIYANKTEDDILVKDLLEEYEQRSNGRFKLHYTLDFPPAVWTHKKGFITADMIKECLPPPSHDTMVFMCGPPPMVEFACKKNLEALGYEKSSYHSF